MDWLSIKFNVGLLIALNTKVLKKVSDMHAIKMSQSKSLLAALERNVEEI